MKISKSLFINFHPLTTLLKLISITIAMFLTNEPKLFAQVKATNGDANTIVNSQGSQQFNITGGTTSGTGNNQNLFHSFDQFNLSKGQIANFISNPNIRNILGKIVGGSPSLINGLIQVTGGNSNLFLMNPSGFVFGTNTSLNVPANFTATTANGISFNGNYWFSASGTNNYGNLTGDPNGLAFAMTRIPGAIINAGNLTVPQGNNILLMGGTVINTGTVTAREGQIVITAVPGQQFVNISFPGNLLSLNIEPLASGNQPNIGNISVTDLPTLLTTGNVGNLTANSDGSVNIDNSKNIPVNPGTNIVSGTLDVSSPSVQGGTVAILGTDVSLNGAKINASGNNGGGTVLIGGDQQGKGTVPNAQTTFVNQNSLINADAITTGNGGKVIVWSDNGTNFAGNITAQGGNQSGDGGFVETSGKNVISIGDQANVNTSASQGKLGTWLLDPTDLVVTSGGSGTITSGTNSTTNSTIDPVTIVIALNGANVNLSADTSITVKDAIDASNNTQPGNLTFASPTININNNITTTGSQTYNGAVSLTNHPILAGNGITFAQTVDSSISGTGNLTVNAGTSNLVFTGLVGGTTALGSLTANGKTIQINNNITTIGTQTYQGAVNVANDSVLTGNGITFAQTVDGSGNLTANAGTSDLVFTGTVGGSTALGTLTANGTTTQINNNITTTGAQTYQGVVSLGNNPVLTGNGITFSNTVDNGSSGTSSLTVNAGTTGVQFQDPVGSTTNPLGNISLTGDAINLSNNIVNSGLITLQPFTSGKAIAVGTISTSDTGLNISSTDLGFLQNGSTRITINGAGNSNISLNAPSFSTPVTVNTGSNGLITDNVITGTGNSSVTLNGTTNLNGNIVTANQGITIKGNITLSTSDVTLSTGTGANITLNGNVNGQNGGENLTLAAGTGNVSVTGQIGSSPTLGSLTISGASNSQFLLSGGITTTGFQTYTVPITLTGTSSFKGNSITFTTVDTNGTNDLTVDAGMGNIAFSRMGSSSNPLRNITLISNGIDSTNIFGTGNITLQTTSPSLPIALGDITNVTTGFLISTTDLGFLKNGFTGITISNGASGTSNIALNSPMFLVPLTVNASNGSITASGTLSNSPVTLNGITTLNSANFLAPLTVTGSSITVNGITTTGNATVNLNGTTYLNSNISTNNQAITINGNTILGDSNSTLNTGTTGADITLNGTVNGTNGGENLSLVAGTGKVTLGGDIGSSTPLGSLTVSGNQNLSLSGNVNTIASQTYEPPILLSNKPISITGNGITFNNTVDGNAYLTVNNGSTNLVFTSPVGSSASLNSLTVNGSTQIDANITTSGSQIYQGAVSLGNNPVLTGNGITFSNTVDGKTDLTARAGSGDLVFTGAVGGTNPLGSLTANGTTTSTIQINNNITTTGNQDYNNPVTFSSDSSLTGNNITFASTVRANTDGSPSVNITSSGIIAFNGPVGDNHQRLANLTTQGTGSTAINVNNITTTGSQTYNNAVNLSGDTTLIADANGTGTGSFTFNGSQLNSNNHSLNVTAADVQLTGALNLGSGNLTLEPSTTNHSIGIGEGATGIFNLNTSELNNINSTGNVTIGNSDHTGDINIGTANTPINLTEKYNLVVTNKGNINLNSDLTTQGDQTYNASLVVQNNTVLQGNNIAINGNIDALADNKESLTVNSKVATILGNKSTEQIGGVNQLNSLTTGGNGTTTINANAINTTGNQTYNENLQLGTNLTITSSNNGNVSFNNSLNSLTDSSNNPYSLTVNTGGMTNFAGLVGNNQPLASLSISTQGSTIINNTQIKTQGNQSYGNTLLLSSDTTLSSTNNGNITFNSTVDSNTTAKNLTIQTDGITQFEGDVGANNPLNSLTTIGQGSTEINGNVTTIGTSGQTYNNQVNVTGKDVALTGDALSFQNNVSGVGSSLTLQPFTPTQAIALGGKSDSTNGILSLNITSINSLQHGFSLITIGRADGSGAITLNSDVTFKDPFILQSPVNAGTINTSGGNLIGIDNASATLQANQNITTGNITTDGNAINITSTNGAIDTSSGTLNSSSSTGNGGAITVFAFNNINTGNINSSAIAGTAGKISITTKDRKIAIQDLNAENLANGRISTGNINASGVTGGDTTIQSFSSLVTGKINSSGTSGNAGNITLGPSNQSIQVDSIKAESSGGQGGNVDISTLVYFIAKDTFIAANGLNASISTLGSTSNGEFKLTNGAPIFEVGDIPVDLISGVITGSGTMGAITTRETQLINVNIPGNYTAPKINISSQEPPPNVPRTTFLVGGLSANLQTVTSTTLGGTSVDPETNNNTEFSNYLGIPDRKLSPAEITAKLKRMAGDNRLKPALIYATFKADPKERKKNSNQPKNVDDWNFPSVVSSEYPTDKLVLKLYLPPYEKPIEIPVDVTRQEIIRIKEQYSKRITDVDFEIKDSTKENGNKLYNWLIPPQVEQLLKAKEINNISFIMDADLRSLPIASLQYKEGKNYFYIVKKYSVGLMPSFSLTDIGDQLEDVNKINILAMGASKFTTQAPLPAAIEELKEINKIWQAKLLMETDFNLENFRKAFSSKYSIIHLATHGHFEPGKISNSYIQFGDTKIPLDKLREKLLLDKSSVKLMTMSACQTAKGDGKLEKEKGELGFASIAAAAGVKTVLASLWYVNDLGTFGLMTSFYKHLQSPPPLANTTQKIPIKVLALQQAQLDMINGKIRVKDGYLIVDDEQIKLPAELDAGDINFSHPYYWSAFTMVGSPR